jgi:polysaccharide deacetylase family protein (PEP-CTERM system associated)
MIPARHGPTRDQSEAPSGTPEVQRRHILTVSVEEYFHAGSFQGSVRRKHWDRLDPRLNESMDQVLNLLRRFNQTATFFVLGCIAKQQPDLVARILADGHEVAASSYWPRSLSGMMPDEFREDFARSRDALENAGVSSVAGYRASRDWLTERDLWVLDVLADEGCRYDSSLNPILRRFAGQPGRFSIHTHTARSGRTIEEFPVTTLGLLGVRVAVSGGNWVRQFPHSLLKLAVRLLDRQGKEPLLFYFMPWEMDRGQPLLAGLSAMTRVRHYRNLAKTRWVFEDYFRHYRFQSIGEYLGLPRQPPVQSVVAAENRARPAGIGATATAPAGDPVTLVVPLFNEEQNVGYLQRTLVDLRGRLAGRFRVHLVLVDDGSTDATWRELHARFLGLPDCQFLLQPVNRGVAAAILAGVASAPTEVVCSIDCDCSYDPYDLAAMIPILGDADMVTASPYHPNGHVLHVPSWRLFLSKTLSRMYSLVMRDRLYTFTSCCRVYRKSAVAGLHLRHGGFLGVAETLILLKLNGARVIEYPATLESRLLGESKMKIMRTIWGHLGLVRELAVRRLKGKLAPAAATPKTTP